MDLHLKSLFNRYQEQFGSGPGLGPGSGTRLMKINGVSPNFVKSIFRASASVYRIGPWKRLRPCHFFGIRVGKNSTWSGDRQPFCCVQFIGGDGGDIGIYMFQSENDAKRMTNARETIHVPNIELLRVTYELESVMFPSHRKMIQSLSLESSGNDRFPVIDVVRCSDSGELEFRNPSLEELKFVYAFMQGFSILHPLLREENESGSKWSKTMCFEPFIETADVQWPPEMIAGGHDVAAVTLSHPPDRTYEEKTSSTS